MHANKCARCGFWVCRINSFDKRKTASLLHMHNTASLRCVGWAAGLSSAQGKMRRRECLGGASHLGPQRLDSPSGAHLNETFTAIGGGRWHSRRRGGYSVKCWFRSSCQKSWACTSPRGLYCVLHPKGASSADSCRHRGAYFVSGSGCLLIRKTRYRKTRYAIAPFSE